MVHAIECLARDPKRYKRYKLIYSFGSTGRIPSRELRDLRPEIETNHPLRLIRLSNGLTQRLQDAKKIGRLESDSAGSLNDPWRQTVSRKEAKTQRRPEALSRTASALLGGRWRQTVSRKDAKTQRRPEALSRTVRAGWFGGTVLHSSIRRTNQTVQRYGIGCSVWIATL